MPHTGSLLSMLPSLIRQGADESVAKSALGLLDQCKSSGDLLRLLGQPDRIDTWSPKDEARFLELQKAGRRLERHVTRYYYHTKWAPLFVVASEGDDGRLGFGVGVAGSAHAGAKR